MDTTPSEYIRRRLVRYEESVDRIPVDSPSPGTTAPLRASAPYAEQCAIPALLDSLAGHPEEASMRQEYARITGKLEISARESGEGYRTQLLEDLVSLVHAHHASACHADLCNLTGETADDPCRRRLISLLVTELRRDHDLSGIDAMLSIVDDSIQDSRRSARSGGEDLPAVDPACAPGSAHDRGASREGSRQIRIG